jgi:hypothetical protein
MPAEIPFTEAIANTICDRLANGESLKAICSDEDMPSRSTVLRWIKASEAFEAQCAHARDEGVEVHMDRLHDIAEQVLNGTITPEQGRVVANSIQWLIMKLKPYKYGDKPPSNVTINNTDNRKIDVAFETLKLASRETLDAAKRQITQALDASSDNDEK